VEMGTNARKRAVAVFDADKTIEAVLEISEKVIKGAESKA